MKGLQAEVPPLEHLTALVMIASLTIYALFGGADYGGGIWDLLSSGPRAQGQRDLIADVIGPIWEANHVWLILVVVLLFTAFPPAYALISIALHVPLTLMLIGIVLRGAAFTFRTYDSQEDRVQRRWGRAFSIASLLTPMFLGVIVGSLASGRIHNPGQDTDLSYFFLWVAPFPFAVGFFTVVLFGFLAAVYLTHETPDQELQNDFRRRAIAAEFSAGILALLVFILARKGAPMLGERLAASWWTWPLQLATAALAIGTLWTLWTRRFRLARFCAAGQVSLILWGWGLAQFPYLVPPELTIGNSAAPQVTLRFVLMALSIGTLILLPSFLYLFRVFRGRTPYNSAH
jgi:cytochrome d ubiquinol oxidase subunit II